MREGVRRSRLPKPPRSQMPPPFLLLPFLLPPVTRDGRSDTALPHDTGMTVDVSDEALPVDVRRPAQEQEQDDGGEENAVEQTPAHWFYSASSFTISLNPHSAMW